MSGIPTATTANLMQASPGALPAVKPAWSVSLGGRTLTDVFAPRLISLTHTDNRGFEADTLEIVLDDSDGLIALPSRGVTLSLRLGWEGKSLADKGEYVIDDIEHSGPPDQLTLRGRSADLRQGITNKQERSWSGQTVGAIVESVAAAYGLEARVSARLAGEVIEHIDQTSESDANLLTRIAEDFDALCTVKKGRLLFMPIGEAESATGIPFPTATVTRQSGDQHRFAIAERDSYTAVRAYYQDLRAGRTGEILFDGAQVKAVIEKASAAKRRHYSSVVAVYAAKGQTSTYGQVTVSSAGSQHTTLRGNAHTLALQSTDTLKALSHVYATRAAALNAARAAWKTIEQKAAKTAAQLDADIEQNNAIELSTERTKTLRHTYASKTNAERAVRAEWQRLQRGLATFNLTLALGREDLFPELPVTVEGFKDQIDAATWLITRVTNTLNDAGFTTALELELKAASARAD
ncbi:contractile injection system protein, VgrG/Pvc8 family [Uliginosibacterium paludis]|uniref:Contractile injection system protein, VgrG/Pvc8 family n=1 Tax=Uliginosibacterium paludis TaxID=1615952 RepID=A0ABV2CUH8_9RHOO